MRESSEDATFIRNGQHLVWPLGLLVFDKADIADSITIPTRLCETQFLFKLTFCSEAWFEWGYNVTEMRNFTHFYSKFIVL